MKNYNWRIWNKQFHDKALILFPMYNERKILVDLKLLSDYELKIFGTRTSLDGTNPIFLLTSSEIGRLMKMNFAFPSELAFNADLFSNTLIKFDNTNKTFDDTIA